MRHPSYRPLREPIGRIFWLGPNTTLKVTLPVRNAWRNHSGHVGCRPRRAWFAGQDFGISVPRALSSWQGRSPAQRRTQHCRDPRNWRLAGRKRRSARRRDANKTKPDFVNCSGWVDFRRPSAATFLLAECVPPLPCRFIQEISMHGNMTGFSRHFSPVVRWLRRSCSAGTSGPRGRARSDGLAQLAGPPAKPRLHGKGPHRQLGPRGRVQAAICFGSGRIWPAGRRPSCSRTGSTQSSATSPRNGE